MGYTVDVACAWDHGRRGNSSERDQCGELRRGCGPERRLCCPHRIRVQHSRYSRRLSPSSRALSSRATRQLHSKWRAQHATWHLLFGRRIYANLCSVLLPRLCRAGHRWRERGLGYCSRWPERMCEPICKVKLTNFRLHVYGGLWRCRDCCGSRCHLLDCSGVKRSMLTMSRPYHVCCASNDERATQTASYEHTDQLPTAYPRRRFTA